MKRNEADVSDATLSKGGQVTSEEKVKRVYPDAILRKVIGGPRFSIWQVWSGVPSPALGILGTAAHRASWAWADAWSKIQKFGSVRREGRKDAKAAT